MITRWKPTDVIRDLFRPDDQKPGDGPSKWDPDSPKRPSDGLSKTQALDDLMQRLADERTIRSQDELTADWNRPKQTVSDWMKEWRRIGIIPPATPAGRRKATAPAWVRGPRRRRRCRRRSTPLTMAQTSTASVAKFRSYSLVLSPSDSSAEELVL
ncbi:hypothetical protein HYPDE_30558 [Hyphomicrobium denitrificans 1NES1]|uniref:Uncharacterized protein n=1 Tax=Hyphomicrobium denitrificans 1NES1 TaxID=670307 RepID=N0BB72_9HYPH|nr:hypothetical protein HYPDE_30558 [Hyphomicrobium denitrificans 1NES1]